MSFLGGRDSALSCAEAVLCAGQARGIGGVGKAECVEFGCNVRGDSDESVGNAGLGRGAFIVGAERCRCEGLVAVGDGGEEMRSFAREVFSVACSGLRHGTICARPSGDGGVSFEDFGGERVWRHGEGERKGRGRSIEAGVILKIPKGVGSLPAAHALFGELELVSFGLSSGGVDRVGGGLSSFEDRSVEAAS